MTISALPTVPSTSRPASFASEMDTFLAAMPTFGTEANALAESVSDDKDLTLAAANTAVASASITAWVSGTTYAAGVVVYGTDDYKTYRRKTAGAGTTNPSADTTNWAPMQVGINDAMVLVTPTFIGVRETKIAMAALDIDLESANYFSKTITATTTLTVSNIPAAGTSVCFILDLTNGGAYTITWWSGVKWASAVAPTLTASGRDVLGFFTHDGGTTWSGLVLGKALA